MKKILITGHRKIDEDRLRYPIEKALRRARENGYMVLITGMALGTDVLASEIALNLGYQVWCAIPFIGHELKRSEEDKKKYWRILGHPNSLVFHISEEPYKKESLFARNRWEVEQLDKSCDMLISVMRDVKSGTGYTVRYAEENGIELVHNLHPDTLKWDS